MKPITDIRVGDILTRPKALGIVTHRGVVVAPNLILQNTPHKGEHLATIPEFSSGKPVRVHRTGANPSIVTARAQTVLANPQKYDVFKNNCEHTATKVVDGIAKSPQLGFFAILALASAALLLASKKG
jgi:hypothetical protein